MSKLPLRAGHSDRSGWLVALSGNALADSTTGTNRMHINLLLALQPLIATSTSTAAFITLWLILTTLVVNKDIKRG